jgi:hypothetical protein
MMFFLSCNHQEQSFDFFVNLVIDNRLFNNGLTTQISVVKNGNQIATEKICTPSVCSSVNSQVFLDKPRLSIPTQSADIDTKSNTFKFKRKGNVYSIRFKSIKDSEKYEVRLVNIFQSDKSAADLIIIPASIGNKNPQTTVYEVNLCQVIIGNNGIDGFHMLSSQTFLSEWVEKRQEKRSKNEFCHN